MATDGPVQQARSQGGWVKAMVDVNPQSEQIVRCFNSQLAGSAASTPPCGFVLQEPTAGTTIVDFGFQVNDRFLSVFPYAAGSNGHIIANLGFCGGSPTVFCNSPFPTPNQAEITTFDGDGNAQNTEFYLVVF